MCRCSAVPLRVGANDDSVIIEINLHPMRAARMPIAARYQALEMLTDVPD